jgi:hypothetical protein
MDSCKCQFQSEKQIFENLLSNPEWKMECLLNEFSKIIVQYNNKHSFVGSETIVLLIPLNKEHLSIKFGKFSEKSENLLVLQNFWKIFKINFFYFGF